MCGPGRSNAPESCVRMAMVLARTKLNPKAALAHDRNQEGTPLKKRVNPETLQSHPLWWTQTPFSGQAE